MRNQPLGQNRDSKYNYVRQYTQPTEIRHITSQLNEEDDNNHRTNRSIKNNHGQYFTKEEEYEKPSLPYYVVPVLYVPQKVLSSDEITPALSFVQKQTGSVRNQQQAREHDTFVNAYKTPHVLCKDNTCQRTNRADSEEFLVNDVNLDQPCTGYINMDYTRSSESIMEHEHDQNGLPSYMEKQFYPTHLGHNSNTYYKNNNAHKDVNPRIYDQFLQQQNCFSDTKRKEEKTPVKSNVFLRWNPNYNYYEIVEETLIVNPEPLNDATNQMMLMKQKREHPVNTYGSPNNYRQRVSDSKAPMSAIVGDDSYYFSKDDDYRGEETATYRSAIDDTKYKSFDDDTKYKSFDNDTTYKSFDDDTKYKSFDNNTTYKSFDDNTKYKSFDNDTTYKSFDDDTKHKSFDNNTTYKSFDDELENYTSYTPVEDVEKLSNHDEKGSKYKSDCCQDQNRSSHNQYRSYCSHSGFSHSHNRPDLSRDHFRPYEVYPNHIQDPFYYDQNHSNHSDDHFYPTYRHKTDPTLSCKKASTVVNKVVPLISSTTISCEPGRESSDVNVLATTTEKESLKDTDMSVLAVGKKPKHSQTTFDDNFVLNTCSTDYERMCESKSSQTLDPRATTFTTGTQTDRKMRAFAKRPPTFITEIQEQILIADTKPSHRETSPGAPRPRRCQSPTKQCSNDVRKLSVMKTTELLPKSTSIQCTSATPIKIPKYKKKRIRQSYPSA